MNNETMNNVRRSLFLSLILLSLFTYYFSSRPIWSADELDLLRDLWLGSAQLPASNSNKYADDSRVAALGEKFFFDSRFSKDGTISCATCHQPQKQFQDDIAIAKGLSVGTRRTQPLVGTAYQQWFFWDGRKDSLWAQALAPLENPAEHGGTRAQYVQLICEHYRSEYEAVFGEVGDWGLKTCPERSRRINDERFVTQVFVNIGKALEAYERTLLPMPTRFDAYVEAVIKNDSQGMKILNADEVSGLKLFIGKARCVTCHHTPLLSDNRFHNTGVPPRGRDVGWVSGLALVLTDEFNCRSEYSDADDYCYNIRTLLPGYDSQVGAFKTPSLRGVALRSPYMHAGQMPTLESVVEHYVKAPTAVVGNTVLRAVDLNPKEQAQLIAFLRSLSTVD